MQCKKTQGTTYSAGQTKKPTLFGHRKRCPHPPSSMFSTCRHNLPIVRATSSSPLSLFFVQKNRHYSFYPACRPFPHPAFVPLLRTVPFFFRPPCATQPCIRALRDTIYTFSFPTNWASMRKKARENLQSRQREKENPGPRGTTKSSGPIFPPPAGLKQATLTGCFSSLLSF
ncbi:hypothetical protein V8C35DRAFT_138950 [Trichoderma chlorosporum]